MALTTAVDLNTLRTRSFLTDYVANQAAFVEVGKIVYQALSDYEGSAPEAVYMKDSLAVALQCTTLFKTLCAAKLHANPIFYPTFAVALARYMLDNDWGNVISP